MPRMTAPALPALSLPALCLLALFLLAAALADTALAADDVTIYRCTDAKGRLALRDTPCRKGEEQETRSMVRPKDGTPPAPMPESAPSPQATRPPAPAPTRVIVVNTPQPLYECVTPDGDRYTSDSPEGHPRWVPLWTLGYPGYRPRGWRGGGTSSIDIDNGNVRIHGETGSGDSSTLPPNRYPQPGYGGAGTWIRDTCHALPQGEVCARLVDQRDEVRRRFFNAQQVERDRLRVEERGINARLDNDCGGH